MFIGSRRALASSGVAYEAEASTLFAAMSAQPDSTRKGVINTLIATLKTAGIWSNLDLLYVLAAHDSQAALLNWKAPGTYTSVEVNSPTFQTDRGYTSNGTTSRLRTQFTPSTNGVKYTQDSASAWVWCVTNGNSGEEIGNVTAPRCRIYARQGGNAYINANDGTNSFVIATSDAVGMTGFSRASSGTKKAWKNGAQIGSDISVASTGLPTQEQWICGANATSFSDKQIGFAAWGAALTGLESALYNAVLSYMQSVGAS